MSVTVTLGRREASLINRVLRAGGLRAVAKPSLSRQAGIGLAWTLRSLAQNSAVNGGTREAARQWASFVEGSIW